MLLYDAVSDEVILEDRGGGQLIEGHRVHVAPADARFVHLTSHLTGRVQHETVWQMAVRAMRGVGLELRDKLFFRRVHGGTWRREVDGHAVVLVHVIAKLVGFGDPGPMGERLMRVRIPRSKYDMQSSLAPGAPLPGTMHRSEVRPVTYSVRAAPDCLPEPPG